jgi:hypothetical protein
VLPIAHSEGQSTSCNRARELRKTPQAVRRRPTQDRRKCRGVRRRSRGQRPPVSAAARSVWSVGQGPLAPRGQGKQRSGAKSLSDLMRSHSSLALSFRLKRYPREPSAIIVLLNRHHIMDAVAYRLPNWCRRVPRVHCYGAGRNPCSTGLWSLDGLSKEGAYSIQCCDPPRGTAPIAADRPARTVDA